MIAHSLTNQNDKNMASDLEKQIKERAFEVALDTRRFEIELYWKRAHYFFGIMCGLGGASAILIFIRSEESIGNGLFLLSLFVIGCIGTVTSFAWYFTNKGSKYWQENWEQYVDALGEDIIGPLFKHPIAEKHGQKALLRYSVSRINEKLSLYAICIWSLITAGVFIYGILSMCGCNDCLVTGPCLILLFGVVVMFISIVFIIGLFGCRSDSTSGPTDNEIESYLYDVKRIAEKAQSDSSPLF